MAMNTNTANIYIKATDNTKQAIDLISGRIKALATTVTAATAGIALIAKNIQTVTNSFEKFSGLNDIADNFDISLEKALGFTDAMNVVGMSAEETTKTFSDLSTNITKAFSDEKLKMTFNQLGVTLKDLKTGNVGDIFEKILNSTANTADKAKQLTLLKDVFGKQGLKILDASQDDRVKNILANSEKMKDVIRATSFVTDEFNNSLAVAGNTIQNDIAIGFAPALPSITAFVESLFSVNDELDKSSKLLSFIDEANTFKLLIDGAFEFADVVTASFVRLGEIVGGFIALIGGSFMKLIPSINLVGDAIFGGIVGAIKGAIGSLGDLSGALIKVIKGDFEGAKIDVSKAFDMSKGWKQYKAQLQKDQAQINFSNIIIDESWKTITGDLKLGRFDKEKAKFTEAFRRQIDGIAETAGKTTGGANRTGVAIPINISAISDGLVKELESQLKIGKDNIDFLLKYNETQYNAQLKDIEEYYKNKKDLMETDYAFQLDIVDKQIALLQKAIPAVAKPEEKVKLEQQVNDLFVKRNKIEKDYQLGIIDFNTKEINDKIQLQELINSRYDTEIEKINTKREIIGLTFEDESKILDYQNKKIANYEKEIQLLLQGKDIAKLTEQDQKTKADLELKIAKIKTDITKNERQKILENIEIEKEFNQLSIDGLELQIENGLSLFAGNLQLKTLKEKQIELLQKEIDKLKEKAILEDKDKLIIAQKEFEINKLKGSTDKVAKDINDALGKSFQTAFGDIISGTKSIKEAFKDMVGNILSTINNLVAQDLGKALYKSIFPGDKDGSGGLGGFVSNLLGSGNFSSGGGLFDSLGTFISGFFASGGYAQAGNAYIVGEKGPELFYPNQSGYVMSNKNSQNMIGGGNIVNVIIQAKDYQSFRNSDTQVAQQLQKALTRGSRNN